MGEIYKYNSSIIYINFSFLKSVIEVLKKGINRVIPETPKEGNIIFKQVENMVIGSNKILLNVAKKKAEELGFNVEIISSELSGDAKDVGKWLAQKSVKIKGLKDQKIKKSMCLISGGETTVTVKGNGLGGRNMELALSFAIEIEGIDGITFLSAGTDGTDGSTDAAGAIVDGKTVSRAKAIGLDPQAYLKDNDSYNFFKKIDELFITGPTGTNVMDIQIVSVAALRKTIERLRKEGFKVKGQNSLSPESLSTKKSSIG